MKLHELPGDPGRQQKSRRVGRGEGSGWGRCAGKGNKGQQSRSGKPKGHAFEGGQMPLIRRIPKFGFSNDRFRLVRAHVNLRDLNQFEEGATVDPAALHTRRMIAKKVQYVKVLATGELTKPLTIKAHGFSARARQAIEDAGGKVEKISI